MRYLILAFLITGQLLAQEVKVAKKPYNVYGRGHKLISHEWRVEVIGKDGKKQGYEFISDLQSTRTNILNQVKAQLKIK